MKNARILDAEPTPERSTCRDLVPVAPGTCPACGADLHVGSSDQPPLFIHGGFGEVRRRIERSCRCGWLGPQSGDYTSENPRGLA